MPGRWSWWSSALMVGACARTPTAASTPSAVAVEPPAKPSTPVVETPPVEPVPAPKPAVAEPERAAGLVATSLPPGTIVAWPSDGGFSGSIAAVLFDDELAKLRAAVAKTLVARGIAVVPIAEIERIEAAAARGELALESNTKCAAPLGRDDVHARYFRDRPRAFVEAGCFEDCRLTVRVETPGADDAYFGTPIVRRPEDPAQWIAAAAKLSDDMSGYGGLGLFGSAHHPDVYFESPAWIGSWRTPPSDVDFDAIEPAVQRCAHADSTMWLAYTVRVAVDRRGHVARCVAASDEGRAPASLQTCLCDGVSEMRFSAGSGARRLRIRAIDQGVGGASPPPTRVVQPQTDAWVARVNQARIFEPCTATGLMPTPLDAMLSLQLEPSGVVAEARLDGGVTTPDAMRWAQCVVGQARSVSLPCAPPGIDVLRIGVGGPVK